MASWADEGKCKVIGNGVVLNPATLFEELESLEKRDYRLENLLVRATPHPDTGLALKIFLGRALCLET